jgi:toxin-antitoxin system PIN domain toxin
MRALLDVNVLIALLDPLHVHHARAHEWLAGNIEHGWASCPLTQLGCVRIMGQPAYPNPQPAAAVARRLAVAAREKHHEFWSASLDACGGELLNWDSVMTSRHATDAYLLALAVQHGGRFATFDRHVPLRAVRGAAARHLVVIG